MSGFRVHLDHSESNEHPGHRQRSEDSQSKAHVEIGVRRFEGFGEEGSGDDDGFVCDPLGQVGCCLYHRIRSVGDKNSRRTSIDARAR